MKIAKKDVTACSEQYVASSLAQPTAYDCAVQNVNDAISSLGELAKSGDIKAREVIANLSVILLDLKN